MKKINYRNAKKVKKYFKKLDENIFDRIGNFSPGLKKYLLKIQKRNFPERLGADLSYLEMYLSNEIPSGIFPAPSFGYKKIDELAYKQVLKILFLDNFGKEFISYLDRKKNFHKKYKIQEFKDLFKDEFTAIPENERVFEFFKNSWFSEFQFQELIMKKMKEFATTYNTVGPKLNDSYFNNEINITFDNSENERNISIKFENEVEKKWKIIFRTSLDVIITKTIFIPNHTNNDILMASFFETPPSGRDEEREKSYRTKEFSLEKSNLDHENFLEILKEIFIKTVLPKKLKEIAKPKNFI